MPQSSKIPKETYLDPSFDYSKLTKDQLRSILFENDVQMPPSTEKKGIFIDLYKKEIHDKINLIKSRQKIKPDKTGINFDEENVFQKMPEKEKETVKSPIKMKSQVIKADSSQLLITTPSKKPKLILESSEMLEPIPNEFFALYSENFSFYKVKIPNNSFLDESGKIRCKLEYKLDPWYLKSCCIPIGEDFARFYGIPFIQVECTGIVIILGFVLILHNKIKRKILNLIQKNVNEIIKKIDFHVKNENKTGKSVSFASLKNIYGSDKRVWKKVERRIRKEFKIRSGLVEGKRQEVVDLKE